MTHKYQANWKYLNGKENLLRNINYRVEFSSALLIKNENLRRKARDNSGDEMRLKILFIFAVGWRQIMIDSMMNVGLLSHWITSARLHSGFWFLSTSRESWLRFIMWEFARHQIPHLHLLVRQYLLNYQFNEHFQTAKNERFNIYDGQLNDWKKSLFMVVSFYECNS